MTIRLSFEIFPPKTDAGVARLIETVQGYAALDPALISVTFGAGGARADVERSTRLIGSLRETVSVPLAAHMTCAGRSRGEVDATVDALWNDKGIRHIVALRGDVPRDPPYAPYRAHPEGYAWTADFVTALRKRYPSMHITVAGYPESHPESPSPQEDLDNLKRKVDAGANDIITQFFFDPDCFLRWQERACAQGINIPLIPGLLPILNFPRMIDFAKRCESGVPRFLHTMFDGIDPESLDHRLLAMNVLAHQITRLIEAGIKRFHLYTLNETLLTRHVATWLRAGF